METEDELTAETALAAYGTLAPGEVNHHVLYKIPGRWIEGRVRGYLFDITWGPADGYPGLYPDADGHLVPVSVLVSDDLDRHWHHIDAFEGPGYRRAPIEVLDESGASVIGRATIYEPLTEID